MGDRVKSNSMQGVFNAAANSENVDFRKYIQKDQYNPLGARELGAAVRAIIESNYNTGAYPVEYDYTEKEQARTNINAANGGTVLTESLESPTVTLANINGNLINYTGKIEPYRSGSGTASDENVRNFSKRNSINLLGWYGKNICGGRALVDMLKKHIPSGVADYVNNTFTFVADASTDPSAYIGPQNAYKANTRYTAIFTMKRSDISGRTSGIRITYTPSGFTNFEYFATPYNSKQTVVTVSDSAKTVSYIAKTGTSGSNTLTIYANESGIFEGVKTASDFVPFDGFCSVINTGDADNPCYGGEFDLAAGWFKPYKIYSDYDGETLVGEWLCNKAEYAADATPPNGSVVVDLGAYGTTIEFDPVLPIEIHKPVTVHADRATNVQIIYEADTNQLIQSILESISNINTSIASLDERVTALETPAAQTTALNPGNSALDPDRSELQEISGEVTRPDVEPTEPNESI